MTRILYFGRLSDVTGIPQETLDLPPQIDTAGELRSWLDLRFDASGALIDPTVRIAINNEVVFDTEPVANANEIAFMPPVGGG